MEKLTSASNFTKTVDLLRNTECSPKEKLNCFHQMTEYITSPSFVSNPNFGKYCSSAISLLLFFCEDLDPAVRMNAEENLNRIVRTCEATRISKISIDLYGEIRKNGNERSLRICLNLFSYYCPRIKEKNIKWYALKLLPCLQTIATRKETLLMETLCGFVKTFSKYLQICLNDNETIKLIEVFLMNITTDCAVKRRCSSQNCLNLIQNSRNKAKMAKYGLNRSLEFLINDQKPNTVLGVLGFLRLLLPFIIEDNICDCKQLVEIFDVCLFLLSNQNHSIINASLEVINSMLSRRNKVLDELLTSHQIQHEFLKKRKSLKTQIFQLKNSEMTCTESVQAASRKTAAGLPSNKHQPSRKSTPETDKNQFKSGVENKECIEENKSNVQARFEINEWEENSNIQSPGHRDENAAIDEAQMGCSETTGEFATLSEVNEPQDDGHLLVERNEDKLQVLSDIDIESFNSIDFESEIAFGEKENKSDSRSKRIPELRSQKSTESIGSFFNSLISHSNAESVTKFFRPSAKLSGSTTQSSLTNSPTLQHANKKLTSKQQQQQSSKDVAATAAVCYPAASNVTDTLAVEDDTISLESINSHLSLASRASFQSTPQDLLRNERDLVVVQRNDYKNEKNVEIFMESLNTEPEDLQTSVMTANAIFLDETVSNCGNEAHSTAENVEQHDGEKRKVSEVEGHAKVDIGTIYDQPIICYTVRLIALNFLLSGAPGAIIPDAVIRVSIKNLSLNVIANCIKLKPQILGYTIEMERSKEIEESLCEAANESSSSELGNDFAIADDKDDELSTVVDSASKAAASPAALEENLLEIKDDHFGESSSMYFLNSALSKSADPVLFKDICSSTSKGLQEQHEYSFGLSTQLEKILCKSEIIESGSSLKRTEVKSPFPRVKPSPLDQSLTKPIPNASVSEKFNRNDLEQIGFQQQKQFVHDILLFHDHPDPILRGDVQIIIGNFISAAATFAHQDSEGMQSGTSEALDFNRLLAILVKGFRDEIHTVVIQALSSFEMVFPLVLSNHLVVPKMQHASIENEDELVENVLKGRTNASNKDESATKSKCGIIPPKLLLNQLHLCFYNKYWLVQNKYADVICSLNFDALRECHDSDVALSYENMFLAELLKLLGDDDFRVRENVADSLCRYIEGSHRDSSETSTSGLNLNLLREFFAYRIFQGMPKSFRNLFNDKISFSSKSERKLSQVLYLLTNKLLELHEKNLQFGIINAIKVLSTRFNPVDYFETWSEFNFAEVCLQFAFQNQNVAVDLNCQSDLIEITAKLLAAASILGNPNQNLQEMLLAHILKILNIYYHLFSNQKPVFFVRAQKSDIFTNTREVITSSHIGYFASDYLYIKLCNILKGAYESYKITINQESGTKLMSLVTVCLDALSVLLDLQEHSKSLNAMKLIEEVLQYTSVLINFEPVGTICCIQQLLKFLFGRNLANRSKDYENFVTLYFAARRSALSEKRSNSGRSCELENQMDENQIFKELFHIAMNFPLGKSKSEEECAKHIKLFEPLVIYCLTLFMKSNAVVQASILDLLTQLLEFNVTYSILDSKHVIFENVIKHLELIENGIARNTTAVIGSIIKFLVSLTKQNNSNLVTIPNIISIINNLLANSAVRDCSVLALKILTFEIYFTNGVSQHPDYGSNTSLHAKERCTQKEVVLDMLEKFIGYTECQKTLSTLLLWNKTGADSQSIQEETVFSMVTKGLAEGNIKVKNLENLFLLNTLFANCDKNVLLDTKGFSSLLSLFITKSADNINDLSCVTIILDKVILNAEEIYLVNHIKLIMKNCECNLSTDEINYFARILYEKLDSCFTTLVNGTFDNDFYILVVKFVKILWRISKWDAINSTFRREFSENFLYGKYAVNVLTMESLQVEILKAICDMNLDKILILLQLQKVAKKNVQKILLEKICGKFDTVEDWKINEVELLFSAEFLSILNTEKFRLVEKLCVVPEFSNILIRNFSNNIDRIRHEEIVYVLKLIESGECNLLKLQLLSKIWDIGRCKRSLRGFVEAAIKKELSNKSEYHDEIERLQKLFPDIVKHNKDRIKFESGKKDVDESWVLDRVISLSSSLHSEGHARILLGIKPETKLKSIFNSAKFNVDKVLTSCIEVSFEAMILAFQQDCIQFNPHINYLNMNILAKISVSALIKQLQNATTLDPGEERSSKILVVAAALTVLFDKINKLKNIGLIYVEYKFVERFIKEQVLRSGSCIELIIDFLVISCDYGAQLLNTTDNDDDLNKLYKCVDKLLHQEFIWYELNQPEKYVALLNTILDMVHGGMIKSIRNTIFYKRYKTQADGCSGNGVLGKVEDVEIIQKAIFIAKLIETKMDSDSNWRTLSTELLKSIAITLFRMDQFYVYAITPWEIVLRIDSSRDQKTTSKLPSIPIDHLCDVDILQKFVKRLSIFGFSTRQQFEEYFMTFLLLINKNYDENMVDVQEQYQIKNTCLAAILELLLTCHTFPVIGNKFSRFHHTTRWAKIKSDGISAKKLNKIQLLVPGSNIFTHPNLERDLKNGFTDDIIGTGSFSFNQFGLNFLWQLMENSLTEKDIQADVYGRNIRNFRELPGIDLKSSFHLIYDVLTVLLEQDHVLVLPNLIKYCEICDNRDQIKGIKNKVLKLQETVPIDDTISHQYIIYLLCKTHSILVPSSSELSHLCSITATYLRSSHVFIRIATLQGLLCLLECCSKTTTTIGKLSEELSMLRDLIVDYITRHGIIKESSLLFSDAHTKLVWTLNFSLIETTTKFVPECNLLSNCIISANNLLKRTTNEDIYLCILHGIERIVVVNNPPQPICDKIEKLSLELVKLENEKFSLPALKLLLSCIYTGSSTQLKNTELSNGIVQDDPEIIAQQTEKVDILLHCIKSSTASGAKIYGEVLCQIIRDLVPPNEILTKVIKEFLAINQPHCEVIAQIVYQVFRSAIDSSFLQMLQDWLICSLPTFVTLPEERGVWCLTVIFLSASINLHLIKLFPVVLYDFCKLTDSEISLFLTSAQDFHGRLNLDQKTRFRDAFGQSDATAYKLMLSSL